MILSFTNGLPLNAENSDFEVNFIDCVIRDKKGKIIGRFSWITDIRVTMDNVYELSRGGRARWKIENETFNTLKNQGYQFEHNFGHGHAYLSHVFCVLMVLAFLIDQVQQKCCGLFQAALKKQKRRSYLWENQRHSFLWCYIKSWKALLLWLSREEGCKRIIIDTS